MKKNSIPKQISFECAIATKADGSPKVYPGGPGEAHTVTIQVSGVSLDDLLSFCDYPISCGWVRSGQAYGRPNRDQS